MEPATIIVASISPSDGLKAGFCSVIFNEIALKIGNRDEILELRNEGGGMRNEEGKMRKQG